MSLVLVEVSRMSLILVEVSRMSLVLVGVGILSTSTSVKLIYDCVLIGELMIIELAYLCQQRGAELIL